PCAGYVRTLRGRPPLAIDEKSSSPRTTSAGGGPVTEALAAGSAGHAGATANLKLTFHLDHSAGADQSPLPRVRPALAVVFPAKILPNAVLCSTAQKVLACAADFRRQQRRPCSSTKCGLWPLGLPFAHYIEHIESLMDA